MSYFSVFRESKLFSIHCHVSYGLQICTLMIQNDTNLKSTVMVFWVILTNDNIAVKLKET